MPLLEDPSLEVRARSAADALGVRIPSFEEAHRSLLEDTDELTRTLMGVGEKPPLASASPVADNPGVLNPVEVAVQIKSIPLFDCLSTRQLVDLAKVVHEETHPSGATVFREGDDGSCMYLIVEGGVEVIQGDKRLAELGPLDFFGEMALFEGRPRAARVATRGVTRLLRLERHDLFALIDEIPAIAIAICRSLSRRVRDLNVRV